MRISRPFRPVVAVLSLAAIGHAVVVGQTAGPATTRTTAPAASRPALPPAGPVVPPGPDFARRLVAAASPSLVAVQYTFVGEVQQSDAVLAGVVVDDRGLVMFPLMGISDQVADAQLQRWKVIVPRPGGTPERLDATFQGRDDRSQLAFVRATPAQPPRAWTPLRFARRPVAPGDAVYSVGLTPKRSGY